MGTFRFGKKFHIKLQHMVFFQESVLPEFEAISRVSEMEERFYEELKVCSFFVFKVCCVNIPALSRQHCFKTRYS